VIEHDGDNEKMPFCLV